MEENFKILLCEDDENLGTLLSEYLQAKGYQADLCPDGEIGYRTFLKNKYDICVLDVMMQRKMVLHWHRKSVRQMQKYQLSS